MSYLLNIVVGFMVFVRAAVIAAVPVGIVAGVYLAFVYYVWSHLLTTGFQHRNFPVSWVLSAVSIVAIVAATIGLHELGRVHRANAPSKSRMSGSMSRA